jgi:hypothetical protein
LPGQQLRNFEIANGMSQLMDTITAALDAYPEPVLQALRESAQVMGLFERILSVIQNTRKLLSLIFEPLFTNLIQSVQEVLAKLHKEDFTR